MEYALSELFTLQMGKTPSRDNSSYWKKSENNWISIADLTQENIYQIQKRRFRIQLLQKVASKRFPPIRS